MIKYCYFEAKYSTEYLKFQSFHINKCVILSKSETDISVNICFYKITKGVIKSYRFR